MGDPDQSGESKVEQFADLAVPAMGREMGEGPLPSKPAEPAEDGWKIPTGPLEDVAPPPDAAPAAAVPGRGSLLHRLTHRG